MKPERVCEISLKLQPSNTITTHPHSFKTITKFPFYFPSFFLLLRLIIIFLFKKLVENKYSRLHENYLQSKEKAPNDPSPPFKEKEKGSEGRSKAWWPMEGSKLGGQWKVPSLVANGMWRKNTFSPLPFSPQQTSLKPSIFSFDLMVLLYHGPKPLLMPFFPFLRSINYDCTPQCNKSFTPSLSIWFWLKIWPFSFPWNYGVAHGHVLRATSCTSKWRTASGVISRSYPNATSLRWRTRTSKGACSSWSQTPSSLVLSYFSKLSHLGDLAISRPRF